MQNSVVFNITKTWFQKRKDQQFQNSEQKTLMGSAQERFEGEICAKNVAK